VLIVTRLDRVARSTRDLLNVLDEVAKAKAGFRSLKDTWADTTTPHGRLMLTVLGASEGTKHARVKDRASCLGAELIGQLTAREMIEIGLERSVLAARHTCQCPGDYGQKVCSAVAMR
jgi:hypothetical protein